MLTDFGKIKNCGSRCGSAPDHDFETQENKI